jgi:hypothetical protein
MITGQLRISRWPLTVINSGSPGPAPMKKTVMENSCGKAGEHEDCS